MSKQELYVRLRELKEAAQEARRRTGQLASGRVVEQEVKRQPGAKDFRSQRISDWAPDTPDAAKVPSPAKRGQFLGLVRVWSAWAGRPFDESSWRTLFNDAQPGRRPAGERTAPPGLPDLPDIPPRPQDFTGRDEELKRLLPLLDPTGEPATGSADPVLVASVAGIGGMGKTALALAAAAEAIERGWFAEALFLDLNGYDEARVDATQALDTFLRRLGVDGERIPVDEDGRAAMYRAQLNLRIADGRGVLVIADNASAEEQVRQLIPGPGPHRLLVTSRHTLARIGAELIDLDVLAPPAAVDLMERMLRTAKRHPDRLAADAEGALRLAEMCGRLPLALQLAAGQLIHDPHLAPGRLADELAEELTEKGSRLEHLDDNRQAVIRASLERSWRLLTIPEQDLLALLALAAGTDISTEAATHLIGQKPAAARRRLADLAATGLVRQSSDGGRWAMHDLVRDYATEHAQASGKRHDAALVRLVTYYMETSQAANLHAGYFTREGRSQQVFRDPGAALTWFGDEYRNLLAAMPVAHRLGRMRTAALLGIRLGAFLYRQQRYAELHHAALLTLEAARSAGGRYEAAARCYLGVALGGLRRFEEAEAESRSALETFLRLEDRSGEPMTRESLGLALVGMRRFEEAEAEYRRGLAIGMELGDRSGTAGLRSNLGSMLAGMRRFEEAEAEYRQGLMVLLERGDRVGEAGMREGLGNALRGMRRFEEAEAEQRAALDICAAVEDRAGDASAREGLAMVLEGQRRFEEAEAEYRRVLATWSEWGSRRGVAGVRNNLGTVLAALERPVEAEAEYRAALEICLELDDREGEAGAWLGLGLAMERQGRFEEAEAAHRRVLAIQSELADRYGEAIARNNLGAVLRRQGRYEEAIGFGRRSVEIFRESAEHYRHAQALGELADTLAAAGHPEPEVAELRQRAAEAYTAAGEAEQAAKALTGTDWRD